MRACPKHASERSLYCTGLSKGLSCAGWLRHPGARPSARSQRRAILAPGCARKPGGRTPVLSARRVPRLTSRLARQLAFLRKPMAAHGVPLPRRGVDGASCTAPPSAMFAATVRPASHPAASGGGPRGDDSPFRFTRRQALAGRRGAPRLCDAFPQVRLLMAAASPCATPPAGIPASSRRECGAPDARAEPRAVFRPCARRTGTTSASGGASSMPRRRGGSAAVRRARRGGKSGSGGAPPREPPRGAGGCVAARTWRRACRKEEPSSRARTTARCRRCKGCACSGRHAECPVEMDAARRPRPGGWTGVRRRGMRTMGCAISTGRRGAAAGARFQIGNTHRQKPRAPCDPRN